MPDVKVFLKFGCFDAVKSMRLKKSPKKSDVLMFKTKDENLRFLLRGTVEEVLSQDVFCRATIPLEYCQPNIDVVKDAMNRLRNDGWEVHAE